MNEQNQTDQTSPGVPEKAREPDHVSDDSEVIEVSPAPGSLEEEGTAEMASPAPPPRPRPVRRRDEPPVLVIEPDSKPMDGGERGGPVSENLEAMVQDLLNKVRSAEDQLRKKEQAISHLQNKTMILAQKLLDQEKSYQQEEIRVGPVMGSDPVSQEAMDFFARALDQASSRPTQGGPGGGSQAARDRRGRDEEARSPRPHQGSLKCPYCGHALRQARCLEVQTTICFSCCGIFLDYNAVRQLARLMPWMRHVQKFLKTSRESREKKSAQEQW